MTRHRFVHMFLLRWNGLVLLTMSSVLGGVQADGRGIAEARSYLMHDIGLSSTLWRTLSSTPGSSVAVTLREAPLRPRFSQEQALLELQFTGDTTHGLRLALEGAQKRLRLRSTDAFREYFTNGTAPSQTSSAVDVDGMPREVVLLFSTPEDLPQAKPNTDVHVYLDCELQERLSLSLPPEGGWLSSRPGVRVYRDKRIKVGHRTRRNGGQRAAEGVGVLQQTGSGDAFRDRAWQRRSNGYDVRERSQR
uniref:Putative secreted protein n=1 Tax=Amblyomma triste TaxID=251400 RepID=A0A023G5V0_AMBTT